MVKFVCSVSVVFHRAGETVRTDEFAVTQQCLEFVVVMAALCNRAGHYIFALWFLSSIFFYSSPNLSGRRLNVYHTSTHGVALVRI